MWNNIVIKVLNIIQKPFKENLEMMIILCLFAGAADGFFWTCHGLESRN